MHNRGIRHAIHLERLKGGQVDKIAKFLSKDVLPDLFNQVDARLTGVQTATTAGKVKRLKSMANAVRGTLEGGMSKTNKLLRQDLTAMGFVESNWQLGAIQESMPVALSLTAPSVATMQAIVSTRPMRGKLLKAWSDELGTNASTEVMRQVNIGLIQGEAIPVITRRIKDVAEKVVRDATVITRTAVNNVVTQAREITYQANESVVKGVRFLATLDARTTEICMSLDGKIFPVGEGPRPPMHLQCRSTTVPVLKSWKEMGIKANEIPPGTRASMNGQVPGTLTYPKWLKKMDSSPKTRHIVDEALGVGKAKLWRRGKLPITKFVDNKFNILTLKELQKLEAQTINRGKQAVKPSIPKPKPIKVKKLTVPPIVVPPPVVLPPVIKQVVAPKVVKLPPVIKQVIQPKVVKPKPIIPPAIQPLVKLPPVIKKVVSPPVVKPKSIVPPVVKKPIVTKPIVKPKPAVPPPPVEHDIPISVINNLVGMDAGVKTNILAAISGASFDAQLVKNFEVAFLGGKKFINATTVTKNLLGKRLLKSLAPPVVVPPKPSIVPIGKRTGKLFAPQLKEAASLTEINKQALLDVLAGKTPTLNPNTMATLEQAVLGQRISNLGYSARAQLKNALTKKPKFAPPPKVKKPLAKPTKASSEFDEAFDTGPTATAEMTLVHQEAFKKLAGISQTQIIDVLEGKTVLITKFTNLQIKKIIGKKLSDLSDTSKRILLRTLKDKQKPSIASSGSAVQQLEPAQVNALKGLPIDDRKSIIKALHGDGITGFAQTLVGTPVWSAMNSMSTNAKHFLMEKLVKGSSVRPTPAAHALIAKRFTARLKSKAKFSGPSVAQRQASQPLHSQRTQRAWTNEASPNELSTLSFWKSSGSGVLRALQKDPTRTSYGKSFPIEITDSNRKTVANFNNMLAKAPRFEGEVWRGISLRRNNLDHFIDSLNDVVELRSSVSTSLKRSVAEEFAGGDVSVMMRIKTKSGVNVHGVRTAHAREQEVILHPKTRLRFISAKPTTDIIGRLQMELEFEEI